MHKHKMWVLNVIKEITKKTLQMIIFYTDAL